MKSIGSCGHALLSALALCLAGGSALASGTHYYVNDQLATTVGIADAAGEIAAMEADAFGSPLAGGANPGRFTGKPYDEDLGAYVFPFRNYRAQEGRWMSADPSGFPDGVNGMGYAPIPNIGMDPLGLAVIYGTEVRSSRAYSENSQWRFSNYRATESTEVSLGTFVYAASWEWTRSGTGIYTPSGGGDNRWFSGTLFVTGSASRTEVGNYLYHTPTTKVLSLPSSSTWQDAIADAIGLVFEGVTTDLYALSLTNNADFNTIISRISASRPTGAAQSYRWKDVLFE